MVKYSGKVVLQTGNRGKGLLPNSKQLKKTCSVVSMPTSKKRVIKNPKARVYCSNKTYGKGPSGVLCKKHFTEKKGLRKNLDRQNMFNVLTEDEKLKLFSKSTFDHQHTVKIPEKKKCKMCNNQMFKEGLCKKHFKNRFFN